MFADAGEADIADIADMGGLGDKSTEVFEEVVWILVNFLGGSPLCRSWGKGGRAGTLEVGDLGDTVVGKGGGCHAEGGVASSRTLLLALVVVARRESVWAASTAEVGFWASSLRRRSEWWKDFIARNGCGLASVAAVRLRL
jgi:hypothetical protein